MSRIVLDIQIPDGRGSLTKKKVTRVFLEDGFLRTERDPPITADEQITLHLGDDTYVEITVVEVIP